MQDLPFPARYFPFVSGRYEVKAGLHKIGHNFGNGDMDCRIFQIDSNWPDYRNEKLAARARDFDRYVCTRGLSSDAERHISQYISTQLCHEHPAYFQQQASDEISIIECALSGETLLFDKHFALRDCNSAIEPAYSSALDALACQVQEDLAFMDNGSPSRLRWLHLCFPNHWAAQDKIGKGFVAIHEPVAEIDRINARAHTLMSSLTQRGPYVRFAWGVAGDPELDCHPLNAGGRDFAEDGKLYLRVERQVTVPIPGHGFLFTIRTYMIDSATLSGEQCTRLQHALHSMSAASKLYKGIAGHEAAIDAILQRIINVAQLTT